MKKAVFYFAVAIPLLVGGGSLACAQQQPPITNSLGMKLVKIPAGEFLMGNLEPIERLRKDYPQYEDYRFRPIQDELPAHRVRITRAFYMGACPATVGQFRQFVAATHYATDAERNDDVSSPQGEPRHGYGGYGYNKETGKLDTDRNPQHNWRNVGFPQTDEHPVTNVSWNDATEFCRWLSAKEHKKYCLPTEAEWEYACRAGTRTRFWSGDDPETLVKIANTYDKSTARIQPEWSAYALKGNDGFEFTAPVGSFKANAFGLYDMHGNVWQWVSDYYAEDYYARSPVDDPKGPPPARQHVRRGGGWATWSFYCRASFRNYNTPQSRYFNLGFRVAMDDD